MFDVLRDCFSILSNKLHSKDINLIFMTKTKDENHNQAPNIFTNVCIIKIHIPQAHEIKNMNIINFIVYYSTHNSREMN